VSSALRFDVITVFPEVFEPVFAAGVVGRAIARGLLELHAHDLRAHTHDRHRQVDDVPYGGGPGMVLKPEPLFEAIEEVRAQNRGPVILLEPWGEPFTQRLARELAAEAGLGLVCGRYEGLRVPEVLLSGNHREIEAWRQAQARRRTLARAGTPQQGEKR